LDEKPPESDEEGAQEIQIQAEDGLLATQDLEEVRDWIFEGRVWPEDLVLTKGGETARADLHPLTRGLFAPGSPERETQVAPEPAPTAAPAEAAGTAAQAEATIDETRPAAPEETAAPEWPADSGWPAEMDVPALRPPEPVAAGVRAVGWLNLCLSLVLPPNPIGVIAAVGLLRGQAWGRTLTMVWGGIQLFVVWIAWFGLTALALATGRIPGPFGEADLFLGLDLLTLVVAVATAMTATLIVQWNYLSRPALIESLTGNGQRAALWGGWLLGWLYLMAAVLLTNATLQRWSESPPATPQEVVETPRAEAPPESRVFTADGLASIVAAPGWEVKAVAEGEDADLGVLLKGRRDDPAGTLRLSAATPQALARLNERFEDLEPGENTIREVEEIQIGDLQGRQVVLSSATPGGTRGDIVLSLHDEKRAYQFACTVPGPGFEQIRPECEHMAASLLITR
jgi:hypothetical protein